MFSYYKRNYNKLSFFLNSDFWSKELYNTRTKNFNMSFLRSQDVLIKRTKKSNLLKKSLKSSFFFNKFIKSRTIKLSVTADKTISRNPFLNTFSLFQSYENFFFIMKFNIIFLFLLLNRFANFFFSGTRRVFDVNSVSNFFISRFDLKKQTKYFFSFIKSNSILQVPANKSLDFFIFFRFLIGFFDIKKPIKSFKTLRYFLNQKQKRTFFVNMSYYHDLRLFQKLNPELLLYVTSKTYSFFIRKKLLVFINKKQASNILSKFRRNSLFSKRFFLLKTFQSFYGKIKINLLKKYLSVSTSFFIGRLQHFLFLLEGRLDVFLWRTNLFKSIFEVRQFIIHGSVFINNDLHTIYGTTLKLGQTVSVQSVLNKQLYLTLYRRLLSYVSDSFWFLSKIEHKHSLYDNFSIYEKFKSNLISSFLFFDKQNVKRSIFLRGFYSPVFFRFREEATRFLDNDFFSYFKEHDDSITNFVMLDDPTKTKSELDFLFKSNFKKKPTMKTLLYKQRDQKKYLANEERKQFLEKQLKNFIVGTQFFVFAKLQDLGLHYLKQRKFLNSFRLTTTITNFKQNEEFVNRKLNFSINFSLLFKVKGINFVVLSDFSAVTISNYLKNFFLFFLFFFFKICLLNDNLELNSKFEKNIERTKQKNFFVSTTKGKPFKSQKSLKAELGEKQIQDRHTKTSIASTKKTKASIFIFPRNFFHVEIQKAITCNLITKLPTLKQLKSLLHFYLPVINLLRTSLVYVLNFLKYFSGFSFVKMFRFLYRLYKTKNDLYVFENYRVQLNDLVVFFKTDIFIDSLKYEKFFLFIKPTNIIFVEEFIAENKHYKKNIQRSSYKMLVYKSIDILFTTIYYVLPTKRKMFLLFLEFSKQFDLLFFKTVIPQTDIYTKIKHVISKQIYVYTQKAALFRVINQLKSFKTLRLHKNRIYDLVKSLKEVAFAFYSNITARKHKKRFRFLKQRFKRNIVKAHKDLHNGLLLSSVLSHVFSSDGQHHLKNTLSRILKFTQKFNMSLFLIDYIKLHTNIIRNISLNYAMAASYNILKYTGKVPRSNFGFLSIFPNYLEFNYSTMCGMLVKMPKSLDVPQNKILKYKDLLSFFV